RAARHPPTDGAVSRPPVGGALRRSDVRPRRPGVARRRTARARSAETPRRRCPLTFRNALESPARTEPECTETAGTETRGASGGVGHPQVVLGCALVSNARCSFV